MDKTIRLSEYKLRQEELLKEKQDADKKRNTRNTKR